MPEVHSKNKLRFLLRWCNWSHSLQLEIADDDGVSEVCQVFLYNVFGNEIRICELTTEQIPGTDNIRADVRVHGRFSSMEWKVLGGSFTLPASMEKHFRLFGPFYQFAVAPRPDGDVLAAAWIEPTDWVAADDFKPQRHYPDKGADQLRLLL